MLRWGEVEIRTGGSGCRHVLRSKTDQACRGVSVLPSPAAVAALLVISPQGAVIYSTTGVIGLAASQISRRIKVATKMASLSAGFSAHSPRVGMTQDLSAAGRSCRS